MQQTRGQRRSSDAVRRTVVVVAAAVFVGGVGMAVWIGGTGGGGPATAQATAESPPTESSDSSGRILPGDDPHFEAQFAWQSEHGLVAVGGLEPHSRGYVDSEAANFAYHTAELRFEPLYAGADRDVVLGMWSPVGSVSLEDYDAGTFDRAGMQARWDDVQARQDAHSAEIDALMQGDPGPDDE